MKKTIFLIITFIFLFIQTLPVFAEPTKVLSLSYDDSSSLIFIETQDDNLTEQTSLKYQHLNNPNRIYFDVPDAILIGEKQQLIFEKSNIKEIRLAQFSTNPNAVRMVVTFEEDFDTSKVQVVRSNRNIIVKASNPKIGNDYFNPVYEEEINSLPYSSIVANSQVVQKVSLPQAEKTSVSVMQDIQKAFENTTLSNSDGKTYESYLSLDLSSNLKLRTKYYINGYYLKNKGLLISGLGQLSASKMFYLDSPKRVVIDLPNTYVDKKIRNKELQLCPDGTCKDVAKIGQFEFNKARVVVTSDRAEKYIPIYSADAQSILLIDSEKLNHVDLVSNISNINKVYVNKIDNKTNEVILSFTSPIVHSILRDNDNLTFYLFNVKSYNEADIIKTLNNTYYKGMIFSLLPQVGVRASMKIKKDDIIKIEQGIDGKALKLTIKQSQNVVNEPQKQVQVPANKVPIKNKIVIDPGHGGSDYGAIREGINEKDITLDVSSRVASILKSKGYKVAMTRSDDTYVSLEDRVEFSENENPEIFISIHVNSAVATEPSGIETHYYHEYSKDYAQVVHSNMAKSIETKDRGLFKSKFYVINHTTVPAILVEIGFLSNADERAELITETRKQKTAKAIAEGIIEYTKSKK